MAAIQALQSQFHDNISRESITAISTLPNCPTMPSAS